MKINITKKQYLALIELLYLGDFMVNGIRSGDDYVEEYNDLREYIYSFAKQMGYDHLIEKDNADGKYYETREFEDGIVSEYKKEYDEEVFWTELAYKLGMRDVERLHKLKTGKVDRETFLREVWSKEDVYLEELMKNGLQNVKVMFPKDSQEKSGE